MTSRKPTVVGARSSSPLSDTFLLWPLPFLVLAFPVLALDAASLVAAGQCLSVGLPAPAGLLPGPIYVLALLISLLCLAVSSHLLASDGLNSSVSLSLPLCDSILGHRVQLRVLKCWP